MKRSTIIASIVAGIVISGAYWSAPSVSALTVGEIQQQISQLLAQITELKNQLHALQSSASSSKQQKIQGSDFISSAFGTSTVQSIPALSKHRVCALLKRNLSHGAQGDDVTGLQEFLNSGGYLSVGATGFFGPLTAHALARWQQSQGIDAAGVVGPLTRARIQRLCGDGEITGNTERFSASPMQGEAPLAVVFSTRIAGSRPAGDNSYTIDFGDGTSEPATNCYAPSDYCRSPGQNTHTYTSNGTYTAVLYKMSRGGCTPEAEAQGCLGPPASRGAVAKLQIRVGANVGCTKEYRPVCGSKPIVCITTPCNPVKQTYGNRCEMNADGATFLYEGQCRSTTGDPANDPQCRSWYDGCNSCFRSAPGGVGTCTLRACILGFPEGQDPKPYCKGYFSDSSNKPPTISSFSGPTTLAVNEVGTWSISASDPENGPLTYSVTWGDESAFYRPNDMIAVNVIQQTTFTHAYSSSGTYNVAIVVRDASGQEAP